MIRGRVDSHRQAWVQLGLKSRTGHLQRVDAVVDTGFDGSLNLPPDIIRELDLASELEANVIKATCASDKVNTWNGDVIWDEQVRSLLILESSGAPLLGMELMEDSRLTINTRTNLDVFIETLDETNASKLSQNLPRPTTVIPALAGILGIWWCKWAILRWFGVLR